MEITVYKRHSKDCEHSIFTAPNNDVVTTDGDGNIQDSGVSLSSLATTSELSGYLPLAGGTLTGTLEVGSAYAVNWSTDTGLSRLGAAIIGLGDGTSGDYSGTLKLTTLEFADSTTMTTAAGGGGGGSVSVNGSSVSSPNFQNSASVTFTVSGSNITLTAAGGGGGSGTGTAGPFNSFAVVPPTPTRNNFTGCVGMTFQVNTPIVVSALGRYYYSSNTQNHVVNLWVNSNTSTPLATTTVLAASSSDANGFKWASITPVTLVPGIQYSIAVDETSGGDLWNENPTYPVILQREFPLIIATTGGNTVGYEGAYSTTQSTFPSNNGTGDSMWSTPAMTYTYAIPGLSGTLAGDGDVDISSPTTGQVLTYSGTVWVNETPSGGGNVLPAASSFTWANQGSSTYSQNVASGPILLSIADSGSVNFRMMYTAAPSTPYKVQAQLRGFMNGASANSQTIGVYFYDGTQFLGIEFLSQSGPSYTPRLQEGTAMSGGSYPTVATFGADNGYVASINAYSSPVWVQLRNDGTTLWFDFSIDGVNYFNWQSQTVGSFITPTYIGFGGISVTSGALGGVYCNLLGWNVIDNATL